MMTIVSFLIGVMFPLALPYALAAEAKLTASTRAPHADFGNSVAVSGQIAVIGAPGDDGMSPSSGAAYVFQHDGERWQQATKLVASDGAPFDAFGHAVAVDDQAILVGAYGRDDGGSNAGAAYIFRHDGVAWRQETKLLPTTPGDAYFGWTVALSGNIAVVGTPYGEGGFLSSGAVYVYRYDGQRLVQETRLISGSVGGAGLRDLFGWSVALSGETLVIGAPSADLAYVLVPQERPWTLAARLTDGEPNTMDEFGYAVAIDGPLLAVGAPRASGMGNNAGRAHLFTYDGTDWVQATTLTPTGVTPGGLFGWSVAVKGDHVVVGSPDSEGVEDIEASGAAEGFRFDGMDWTHVARVTANDGAAHDRFGTAVAISHKTLLVGAPGDDEAAGSAYVWTFASRAGPPIARVDSIHYATSGGIFAERHLSITVSIGDDQGHPVSSAPVTIQIYRNAVPYWTASAVTNLEGSAEFPLKNYPAGCYRTTVLDLNGATPATPENQHCKDPFLRAP